MSVLTDLSLNPVEAPPQLSSLKIQTDMHGNHATDSSALELTSQASVEKENPNGNLVLRIIDYFNSSHEVKEVSKSEFLRDMQASQETFEDLNKLTAKFLAPSQDKESIYDVKGSKKKEADIEKEKNEADFRNDPEAMTLIDKLQDKYPILRNHKTPYYYPNKADILSFLMQRSNDLSQVSQKNMMFLNQKSEEQRVLFDSFLKLIQEYLDLEKSHAKLSSNHA